MSYTDKCCGVCGEYQDLRSVGTEWLSGIKMQSEKYLRFWDDQTNVCPSCVEKQALKGIHIKDLTLHKKLKESKNITKGFTWFVNPETDKLWRCPNTYLEREEQQWCSNPLKFSKTSPDFYEVTGVGIKHEGLFTQGGIYCRDKRRLRRTLRKLGIKGKVELLIK